MADLLVLNTSLNGEAIIDTFKSIIWTGRYNGYGDFELYIRASEEILNTLLLDRYLCLGEFEQVMIIEKKQLVYSSEEGSEFLVSGRSLESILDRRIIWSQTVLTGNLQNGIQKLLNENIISPNIPERKLSNFIFQPSTDTLITSLTFEGQFTRDNLYETIVKICASKNIGFKITLSETNQFVFSLYSGKDRSYAQEINPYVVFSPKFDNLIGSKYKEDQTKMKNVSVIAGEGEGESRKTSIIGTSAYLARRENYTDARDLSQTVDSVVIPDITYIAQLQQRGYMDLADKILEKTFDGQVDTKMYPYSEAFFMGDMLQIDSTYSTQSKARVVEMIYSQSDTELQFYPTFTII